MTRAFFMKDVRLATRGGTLQLAVTFSLIAQAVLFAGFGSVAYLLGEPLPQAVVAALPEWLTNLAFLFALVGPGTAATAAMRTEIGADIGESLASAPLDAASFFLGKAALPVISGVVLQLSILPMWCFLWGEGMVSAATILRVYILITTLVITAASVGAARYRVLQAMSTGRYSVLNSIGLRRSTMAQRQQVSVLLIMLFVSSGMFRALGVQALSPSIPGGLWMRVLDSLRPLLPSGVLGVAAPVSLYGWSAPAILVGPLLILLAGAASIGRAIVLHPRVQAREGKIALALGIVFRAVFVTWIAGSLWIEDPGSAVAFAGLLALVYAVLGTSSVRDRRLAGALAAAVCALPFIGALLALSPGGAVFWIGTSLTCAAVATALPAPGWKRTIALVAMLGAMLFAPVIFEMLHGFVGGVPQRLLEIAVALSPASAILSLAHAVLSPMTIWTGLPGYPDEIEWLRPWLLSPVFFGIVAALALRLAPARATQTTVPALD